MVRVKVCGITNEEDLAVAVKAGADAVGFIVEVEASPRNLKMRRAKELMRKVPIFVSKVAVTVLNGPEGLEEIRKELRPDCIQIHEGRFDDVALREVLGGVKTIRVLSIRPETSIKAIVEEAKNFDAILIDTYVEGKYGGTGMTGDLMVCKKIRDALYPMPLILAGGMRPGNVVEAIRIVHPYAVDVCSGVEAQPGVKDHKKVFEFVIKAKGVGR